MPRNENIAARDTRIFRKNVMKRSINMNVNTTKIFVKIKNKE